jgi:hypothetical protein
MAIILYVVWDIKSHEIPEIEFINGNYYDNALVLAIQYVPMMSGDKHMLNTFRNYVPIQCSSMIALDEYLVNHDPAIALEVLRASYDQHSKPFIILYYQACVAGVMSTKAVSSHIWNVNSCYNIRKHKNRIPADPVLCEIQDYLANPTMAIKSMAYELDTIETVNDSRITITTTVARTTFLILYGQKFRCNGKDILIAGSDSHPFKIKSKNSWINSDDWSLLKCFPKRSILLEAINPPFGYKWSVGSAIVEADKGVFMVNKKEIPLFDASSLLIPLKAAMTFRLSDKNLRRMIIKVMLNQPITFNEILSMRQSKVDHLINWSELFLKNRVPLQFAKLIYSKLFNQNTELISIGPVDRGGNRMHNSINYEYEGKLWKVFSMFSMLYPLVVSVKNNLNFSIKRDNADYVHLVRSIEYILDASSVSNVNAEPINVQIKTKLWDHQLSSSNKIVHAFGLGHKGFGDASDVGAGKTLTALNISAQLVNVENKYSGILIMLPTAKLIDTWNTEISKHTVGFDVIVYNASTKRIKIKQNTLFITTMGRIRDHPIDHRWTLVIIDECLSVQNREALHTEEAWKQSLCSKHLIMMSATFFKTRFDKLYYMLKMLQTGIPEQRDYLDVLLNESIVCHMNAHLRNWVTTNHTFQLNASQRVDYDLIAELDLSVEKKYAKLASFLTRVGDEIIPQLRSLLIKLNGLGRKVLIYARSKEEANAWSLKLKVPIYGAVNKTNNCIITLANGTYGLNDLVIYDTILMRPPEPDKLPQIRGRLDRPGQLSDNLYMEYFIVGDTIEEGLIARLNIASRFIHEYIMPLANFYELSVTLGSIK